MNQQLLQQELHNWRNQTGIDLASALEKNIQKKNQKMQHDFLMNLIEQEKAAGKFNMPITANDETQILGVNAPLLTDQNGPIL
jgi:hypothetical protein